MPPLLSSQHTRLRPLQEADAPAMLELYGDWEVMRYWNHAPWTTLAQAQEAITESHSDIASGNCLHWAIEHCGSAALAGSCALYDISLQHRRAKLGYLLGKAYWSKGYFQDALRVVLDHAMQHLGLNRVEAEIDVRNLASAKALERAGFRREGTLRQAWIVGGSAVDIALYALLAGDRPTLNP